MLTLFFRMFSLLCVAWAEAPNPPTHLDYRVDARLDYFQSDTNFLAGGGTQETLPNSGYFHDMIITGLFTQDLDKTRRFYGGFNYSMTESYDGRFTRSNSGFNELLFGSQYWLKVMGYHLAPTAEFVYPLVRVDKNTDDALLGEGAMKLRLGSWWMMGNPVWDPFLFLGYEYRDEGRSHAVPYTVGVKWRNKPGWMQLEYRGNERLFANSDTENRNSRDTFLRRVNGGSYRYYAINSAVSEAALEAGWSFGTFGIYGGFAYTVNGSSAAQGYNLMIGAAYTPGLEDENEKDRREKMGPVDIPDRFTPYIDPMDDLDPTKPPKKRKPRPPPPPPSTPPPEIPSDFETPAPPPKAAPKAPAPGKAQPGTQPQFQPEPLPPPGAPSSSPLPNVKLMPAPKKGAPPPAKPQAPPAKPAPKPVKKNKVDKMLDEAEKNLKGL